MSSIPINKPGAEIPEKTLVVLPQPGRSKETIAKLLDPLNGQKTRDWWHSHFYYCLPLAIGNQYGFVIRAAYDFSLYWNGGLRNEDLKVECNLPQYELQNYEAHFGSGIVTVQNLWVMRTPPGVNIMTMQPPNFLKPGIMHLSAVVETDNLRRDFTFNMKVTEPNRWIHFKAGEPVGAFVCIPRHFTDEFKVAFADELFNEEQIKWEQDVQIEFSRQRSREDKDKPHEAGRRYFRGEDAWGNEFPDHQIIVKRK